MKKLKKGQRGFTLIEVLIVITLTGLIAGGLTTTIMQVVTMSHRTANRMTAVRQVQQAGFWVSPDVQMSQPDEVDTGNDPGTPEFELLTLGWIEFEGAANPTHEVIYTLEDGELWRSHSVGGGVPTVIRVAEYIDSDPQKTKCEIVAGELGDELKFTVTATVGEQSETKIYRIKPRPESS